MIELTREQQMSLVHGEETPPRVLDPVTHTRYVLLITSVTRRVLERTQLLVELSSAEGRQSGLRQDSVVNCVNILTVDKSKHPYPPPRSVLHRCTLAGRNPV